MKKSVLVTLGAAAAFGVALSPAVAQQKSAPKAYVGPSAHLACGKLAGDKRDACIRKLPTQVFATVKSPAVAKAAAAPAAAAVATKAAAAPKGYVGPAAHLACAKMPGDKRDACIRSLPVVKGPGVATVTAGNKK